MVPLCGRADLCAAQLICFYRSNFLHEIGGILWLTLWRCWLHSCEMFSLLVEYGLVHRGDCINCETCYFCFDPSFVLPRRMARRLSLCLAWKPFPGLCACTRTGRWCASVVAIRSLSLFTNRADRCSRISSLDSWYAIRVSKTLDVIHGCALLTNARGARARTHTHTRARARTHTHTHAHARTHACTHSQTHNRWHTKLTEEENSFVPTAVQFLNRAQSRIWTVLATECGFTRLVVWIRPSAMYTSSDVWVCQLMMVVVCVCRMG